MLDPTARGAFPYGIAGEIDIAVSAATEEELFEVAIETQSSSVVFDCTKLTFIDASGITALLNVVRRSEKRVRLVNLTPSCRRVFEVLDLFGKFGIEPITPLQLVPLSA